MRGRVLAKSSTRIVAATAIVIGLVVVGGLQRAVAATLFAPAWGQGTSNGALGAPDYNGPTDITNPAFAFYAFTTPGGGVDVRVDFLAFDSNAPGNAADDVASVQIVAFPPQGCGVPRSVSRDVVGTDPVSIEASTVASDSPVMTCLVGGVWKIDVNALDVSGNRMTLNDQRATRTPLVWEVVPRDVDGTPHAGRVWVEDMRESATILTNSMAQGAHEIEPWNQTLWWMASSGSIYRQTLNGFNGLSAMSLQANSIGTRFVAGDPVNCQPANQSAGPAGQSAWGGHVTADVSTCRNVQRYRAFFEQPDPAMPETATFYDGRSANWVYPVWKPPVTTVQFQQTGVVSAPNSPLNGTVSGVADQPGTLIVDLGDSAGNLLKSLDVGYANGPWSISTGPLPITVSDGMNIEATFNDVAPIYFPTQDVETRSGGIEIEALTGPAAGGPDRFNVWWNDAERTASQCFGPPTGTTPTSCTGAIPTAMPTGAQSGVSSLGGVHGWGFTYAPAPNDAQWTWGDSPSIANPTTILDWVTQETHASFMSDVLIPPAATLAKSADKQNVRAGENTIHTWVLSNQSPYALTFPPGSVQDSIANLLTHATVSAAPTLSVNPSGPVGNLTLDQDSGRFNWSGTLAAGATLTVSYTLAINVDAVAGTITDTVTAKPWGLEDIVKQPITPAPRYELQVVLTQSRDRFESPDPEWITYTYLVTNVGAGAVEQLAVTDELELAIACPTARLEPGESTTCTASAYQITAADRTAGGVINTARATSMSAPDPGTAQQVVTVAALSNTVVAIGVPKIALDKRSTTTLFTKAGEAVSYSFEVTNTGATDLNTVTLSDPKLTGVACSATSLIPGKSMMCSADRYLTTEADVRLGHADNIATVEAIGATMRPDGPKAGESATQKVTASDTHSIPMAGPSATPALPRTGGNVSELPRTGLVVPPIVALAVALGTLVGGRALVVSRKRFQVKGAHSR